MTGSELRPEDVLVDLLGSGDFDHEILDPEAAARIIMQRLADAGFVVVDFRLSQAAGAAAGGTALALVTIPPAPAADAPASALDPAYALIAAHRDVNATVHAIEAEANRRLSLGIGGTIDITEPSGAEMDLFLELLGDSAHHACGRGRLGDLSRRGQQAGSVEVRGQLRHSADRQFGRSLQSYWSRVMKNPAKTAKVIQLPHDDFSFKACNLKRSLPEKYDTLRPYVVVVDGLIRMDASTLRLRVGAMKSESVIHVGGLISDLESVAEDFEALASFFKTAAARLTVVKAKLV
jgi:hypothetical protein